MSIHPIPPFSSVTPPTSPRAEASSESPPGPMRLSSTSFYKFVATLERTLPELGPDKALQIANKVVQIQPQLRASSDVTLALVEPTHEIDHDFAITRTSFSILREIIGTGGNCNVRRATTIPTERTTFGGSSKLSSPSKAVDTVLKRTICPVGCSQSPLKRSIEASISGSNVRTEGAGQEKRERTNNENATEPKRQRTLGIARMLDTAVDLEGHSYIIAKRRDNNVCKLDYSKLAQPVKGALKILSDVSNGLGIFHASGKSHKDVKGLNILYKMNSDNVIRKGLLDDHEQLAEVPKKETKTFFSHMYADPSMFETGANNLIKQKERMGIQSLEGDIYALGVTICRDFIVKIARSLVSKDVEKQSALNELINQINPQKIFGPFSPGALKKNAMTGSQMVYVESDASKDRREWLMIHPSPITITLLLNAICDLIKEDLRSEAEFHALKTLGKLSCDMRAKDASKRPKIEQVYQRINEIIQVYEHSFAGTNSTTFPSSSLS